MKKNILVKICGLFLLTTLLSGCGSGNKSFQDFFDNGGNNNNPFGNSNKGDNKNSSSPSGNSQSSSTGNKNSSNNGGHASSSNNGGSASQTGDTVDINNPYFDFSWNSSDHTASICFLSGMENPNPIVPITYVYNGENYRIIDDGKAPGFSYMMIVETITIQEGFEKIQNGFCHDMNLISVKLPSTLKKIHAAPFVNCSKLQKVEYNGTMAQWEAIQKDNDYNYGLPQDITIVCKDGNLTLPKDPDW